MSDNNDLEYCAVRERIYALSDMLKNGIRYDKELKLYVVFWTAREIEAAKKEADELAKFFVKTLPLDDG